VYLIIKLQPCLNFKATTYRSNQAMIMHETLHSLTIWFPKTQDGGELFRLLAALDQERWLLG